MGLMCEVFVSMIDVLAMHEHVVSLPSLWSAEHIPGCFQAPGSGRNEDF
jgi:hypothetical protein